MRICYKLTGKGALMLLLLGTFVSVSMAAPFKFENFTTGDGLSNNAVQVVFQDSRGYLWIGTEDGLNRYDGYTFTIYRNDPADSASLSHNSVWAIYEDKKKQLWIGTKDGLCLYNKEKENFTVYRYRTPDQVASIGEWTNTVTAIYQESEDKIWLTTVMEGMVLFNPQTKSFEFYPPDWMMKEGTNSNVMIRVIPDKLSGGKKLWVARWAYGLVAFDLSSREYTRYKHNPKNLNSIGHNELRSIYQQDNGILWIGSLGGLDKFDPATGRFTRFRHRPNDPSGLSDKRVLHIVEDLEDKNILWIGTGNGLNRFNIREEKFTRYLGEINVPGVLNNNVITSLYWDRSGVLWIGTMGGVNKMNPARIVFNEYLKEKKQKLENTEIYGVRQDLNRPDYLWIASYGAGLYRLDQKNNRLKQFSRKSTNGGIVGDSIRALYPDPKEKKLIWLGTWGGGLSRFNTNTGQFTTFKNKPTEPKTISSNRIRRIFKTRDGDLWIATLSGLNLFNRQQQTFTRFLHQDTSYTETLMSFIGDKRDKNPPLASITKVRDFADKTAPFSLDKKTPILLIVSGEGDDALYDYGELLDAGNKTLFKMELAATRHAGGGEKNRIQLWLGTLEEGSYKIKYHSDDSHAYNSWNVPAPARPEWWGIQALALSPEEYAFIEARLNKFEKPNSIISSSTTAIEEDVYGMLWVGTMDKGLSRFDRRIGKFTNYSFQLNNPGSISNNQINDMLLDKNGTLWIATQKGLNRYVYETDSFMRYGLKDGLPNNHIVSILADAEHKIWLATLDGISRFDPNDIKEGHTPTFVNYTNQDGLPFIQFKPGTKELLKDGGIIFAGNGGLTTFFPGEPNAVKPQTVVSGFYLSNKKVSPGPETPLSRAIEQTREINLAYDQNIIAFEFAALHFVRPDKNKFLYKLEGFEEDWIDGDRRYAPYTNLDPGEYVFRVKSSNSDGLWDERGASIRLNILPPWWRTWWAYGAYGFLLIVVVVAIDRLQRRRILAKNKEEMRIREMEMRAEAAELQAKASDAERRALEAENKRKSEELEEARQLQLSMLPRELPQLPNLDIAVYMQTATEVGGDYYDFHVGLDGTLTVVIGDATGHGMKAGTMVTAAKSLFNSYAPNPDILYSFQEITRCIKSLNMGKMSMCLTMLKIKGGKMRMSTAGMPPSFIFRRETRVVEEHLFQAMPLGTMMKFPYEVKDTTLKPGDTILLMSDGLPELQSDKEEMYGYKRIRNGFEDVAEKAPEEIISFLKNEGKKWNGDQAPDDDVTFVVVKVK